MVKLNGLSSSEFIAYFTNTIEELNSAAMNYVKNNNFEPGFEILAWCEKAISPSVYGNFPILINITFNNIGCACRRIGQLQRALDYLENALEVLIRSNNQQYSSRTYLNLCAVLSQLGNHEKAAEHAKSALIYAQDELLKLKEIRVSHDLIREKVSLLAIAYHNIGVEEEFRGNLQNALSWYEKSVKVVKENDFSNENLTQKLILAHEAAKKKYVMSQLHRPRPPYLRNESVRSSGRSVSAHRKRNLNASKEFNILNTEQKIKEESAKSVECPMTNNFVEPPRDKRAQFFFHKNRIVEQKGAIDLDSIWNSQTKKSNKRSQSAKYPRSNRTYSAKHSIVARPTFTRESYERETEEQRRLIDEKSDRENSFKLSFSEAQKRELRISSDLKSSNRNKSFHLEIFQLDQSLRLDHSGELNRSSKPETSFEVTRKKAASPDERHVKNPSYFDSSNDEDHEDWKIKVLKKAGVFDSPGSGRYFRFNSPETDELKENRLKFLASISFQSARRDAGHSETPLNRSLNFDLVPEFHSSEEQNKKPKTENKKQKTVSTNASVPSQGSDRFGLKKSIAVERYQNNEDEGLEPAEISPRSNLSHYSIQNSPKRPTLPEKWKRQEEAAIKIQANYKGQLARERFLLLQEHNTKYKNKKLLLKQHLSILTKLNKNDLSLSKRLYNVKIYFYSEKAKLYAHLLELLERNVYDIFVDIPKELLKQKSKLKESAFFKELTYYAEKILPTIFVEGKEVRFDTKDVKSNHQGQSAEDQKGSHVDADDNEYNLFISKSKQKPLTIGISQRNEAATKLAAVIRGYFARQQFKLLKERRTQTLFVSTEKIDERIIQIKILKIIQPNSRKVQHKGNLLVKAYDFTVGVNFQMLLIPDSLLSNTKNSRDVLSLVF